MLVKLVNKSQNLKFQERIKKQHRAESHSQNAQGIEIDLFQINQQLKNEIGKDVDMIETYFQESLKSIYITVLEYLQNVPQTEPDFLKSNEAEEEPEYLRDVKRGEEGNLIDDGFPSKSAMDAESRKFSHITHNTTTKKEIPEKHRIRDSDNFGLSNSNLEKGNSLNAELITRPGENEHEWAEDEPDSASEAEDQDQGYEHDDDGPELGIDESQHEEFTTIRLKKLVCSLISEFKPCNQNFHLNDEEME